MGCAQRLRLEAASAAILACLAAVGAAKAAPLPAIKVVSSRPDMVTEGSALVAVTLPSGVSPSEVKLFVNGAEVTGSLKREDSVLVARISDLQPGANRVRVTVRGTSNDVVVVNHDRNGPIISGPHQTPFICETSAFKLPDGTTLGPPLDENCNAQTKVIYLYKPKEGQGFKALPSTQELPPDITTTKTTDGRTVNYVIRLETGTINRAIYQTAVLHDPTADPPPSPWTRYKGWNRKIVYLFGGSASAGYHQGNQFDYTPTDVLGEEEKLSRGFAVLSSTLNISGVNPSDPLSAETVSMVKERFIKTFGAPIYTMGWGGSGGAMQQHLIANNYPGLLDGIDPAASFSDMQSVTPSAMDCALLAKVFNEPGQAWTESQKTAISGFNTWQACASWNRIFSPMWMQAGQVEVRAFGLDLSNCAMVVPKRLTYEPRTNPRGARCDIYSGLRNQLGVDPSTGFTRRAFDNVGVEYGLKPFRTGAISAEQFVLLNEQAGGFDGDGNYRPTRTAADPIALTRMYRFGRINDARRLGDIPIIDFRGDPGASPDVHDSVRSLITRARIIRANGSAANQIIIRQDSHPTFPGSGASPAQTALYVLLKMDEWLSKLGADHKAYPNLAAKVLADKPADLSDACVTPAGEYLHEAADINNGGRCGRLMQFHSNPRMVAGEPLTDDVLKCSLKPLARRDYGQLTDVQWKRLRAVFPTGVCDYSKPGVGAQRTQDVWLAYPRPGVAEPFRGEQRAPMASDKPRKSS